MRNLSSVSVGLKASSEYHAYPTREFHYDGPSCNLLNPPPIWTVLGGPNGNGVASHHPWQQHQYHHPQIHPQHQVPLPPTLTSSHTTMRPPTEKSNVSLLFVNMILIILDLQDEMTTMGIKYEPLNEDDSSLHDDEVDDHDAEQSTSSDPDSKSSTRQKTQRNRTAFTQEQIAALEKGFLIGMMFFKLIDSVNLTCFS